MTNRFARFNEAIRAKVLKMSDKLPIVEHEEIGDSESTSASGRNGSCATSNSGGSAVTYEDNGVVCPSCNGTGSIPKEREKQLVALIPLTDKRLKPRRTTLYVLTAVFLSVVVCGLCMFFLIPRSITLSSNGFSIVPYNTSFNKNTSVMTISFFNEVNITNSNYLTVSIVDASMSISDTMRTTHTVLGHILNSTQWNLSLRSQGVVTFDSTITLEQETLIEFCSVVKLLFIRVDFMVTCRYMGHEEQSSLSVPQKLSCETKPES